MNGFARIVALTALLPLLFSCASEITAEEERILAQIEGAAEPDERLCVQIQVEWLCEYAGCTWSWSGCVKTAPPAPNDEVLPLEGGPVQEKLGAGAELGSKPKTGGAKAAGGETLIVEEEPGSAVPLAPPQMCAQIKVQWLCKHAGCFWDRTAGKCTHPPIIY